MSDNVIAGGFQPDLEQLKNELLGSAHSPDELRAVTARMKAGYRAEVLRDAVRLAARALRNEVLLAVGRHKNLENVARDEFGDAEANDLGTSMDLAGQGEDPGETVEEIAANMKRMIERFGGTEVSIDIVHAKSSDDDIVDAEFRPIGDEPKGGKGS